MQTVSTKAVSLDQIVKPLVDLFGRKYPSKHKDLRRFGTYGKATCRDVSETDGWFHEALVALYLDPATDEHALAALVTLLDKSSPCVASNQEDYTRPLNFTLTILTERCPDGWMTLPELRITLECDTDSAAAVRQIELLTQHLGDKRNLLKVGPVAKSFFGFCAK